MPYGKKALTPEQLAQMGENKMDRQIHAVEKKMTAEPRLPPKPVHYVCLTCGTSTTFSFCPKCGR